MEQIIKQFHDYSAWLETLESVDEALWNSAISEGKWSVKEVISHIMKWDKYLLEVVIPSVKGGGGIVFPEFGPFNQEAADYAKSGISQSELLRESIAERERLVHTLNELSKDLLAKAVTCNAITHCPHTGTPYSLIYIIEEFIQHDQHHQKQIIQKINH